MIIALPLLMAAAGLRYQESHKQKADHLICHLPISHLHLPFFTAHQNQLARNWQG